MYTSTLHTHPHKDPQVHTHALTHSEWVCVCGVVVHRTGALCSVKPFLSAVVTAPPSSSEQTPTSSQARPLTGAARWEKNARVVGGSNGPQTLTQTLEVYSEGVN